MQMEHILDEGNIMTRLLIYSNRHIREQSKNLQDNDTLIVDNKWSIKDWKFYLKYKKIKKNINIYTIQELLKGDLDNMKFDYIVGNPPYQIPIGDGNKTKTIWDELVIKFYELLEEKGEMSMIHPGTWRFSISNSVNNNLYRVKEMYNENNIDLELHDMKDGNNKFGASTDYDIIKLIKEKRNRLSTIKTKSENLKLDLNKIGIIPTKNIQTFLKLKSKNNEEKVKLIHDSSYHHANGGKKCRVRPLKDKTFKYPVVYTITDKNGITFWFSNTKSKGHFDIPKLILKSGSKTSLLDLTGEFGMTEFASGIADLPENLIKIQKVIDSKEFKQLQADFTGSNNINISIDGLGTMFKFIKEFRKDFWKEFYTDEMEKELIEEGKLDANGKYIG